MRTGLLKREWGEDMEGPFECECNVGGVSMWLRHPYGRKSGAHLLSQLARSDRLRSQLE